MIKISRFETLGIWVVFDTGDQFLVKVYGCRGSLPSPRRDKLEYGGNTSCFTAEINGRVLVFDCGTGAAALSESLDGMPLDVFFSHMHLDHVLGVPFFQPFFSADYAVRVYGEARKGVTIRGQLAQVMCAPIWPVGIESFQKAVRYCNFTCGDRLDMGDGVSVLTERSNHPNQCTHYRVEALGKSLVYALDYEHSPEGNDRLCAFAQGCDLLIYDAQFTDEEYARMPGPKGWGHSTWQEGVRMARRCGAARLLLAHHSPERTDGELHNLEKEARGLFCECSFAREGQVIAL